MTPGADRAAAHLEHARKVADAVLYEGYLLYPYRQSAQKNRSRFQFGVLMPPAYGALDPSEPSASQTECLIECGDDAMVTVLVRFLQLRRRRMFQMFQVGGGLGEAAGGLGEAAGGLGEVAGGLREVDVLTVDGADHTSWDEATEREQQVSVTVGDLLTREASWPVRIEAGSAVEDVRDAAGRLAGQRRYGWAAIDGSIRVRARRVAGPYQALRLTLRIVNQTRPPGLLRDRDDALACAMIAAHALAWVPGGAFLSMTDPPQWAAAEVAACANIGTWPVLAGPPDCRDLVLSSPVILHDHAEVAPESAGDLFDSTEIDEILTLRTQALTDSEKRAARATDPRAAELIDRLDGMPPELLDRLHGAIRYLGPARGVASVPAEAARDPAVLAPGQWAGAGVSAGAGAGSPGAAEAELASVPWWDPGSDASVSPGTDRVDIGGVPVGRGSRVVMRPGARRADAQDLFLVGRAARVEAVLHDVDGNVHLAVSPDDDPAADLNRSHGRFLYFATDEVEPLEPLDPVEPAPDHKS